MEAFEELTLASTFLKYLDVPSLYYIFYSTEPFLPRALEQGLQVALRDSYCIEKLYLQYALDVEELTFPVFFSFWKKKHLFSSDMPLAFLLRHWKVLPLETALCKAAKARRFDFVDALLTRKCLWHSHGHIEAICHGIVSSPYTDKDEKDYFAEWHIAKIEFYCDAFCKGRYTEEDKKGYLEDFISNCGEIAVHAGLSTELFGVEYHAAEYILAERWDDVRNRVAELVNPIKMSWIACHEPKLYFHPERIPEDLRQYFVFDTLETRDGVRWLYTTPETFLKLAKRMDVIKCRIGVDNIIDFADVRYLETTRRVKELRLLKLQPWIQFALGELEEVPLIEELVSSPRTYYLQFYAAYFVLWCCKKGLLDGKKYDSTEYKNLFWLIRFVTDPKQDYYPEILRYLCEHHYTEVRGVLGEQTKARLLEIVKGDEFMTKFVWDRCY